MMRGDASLKGKIKALAKKSNLKPQELLQMYLFEHLLVRLGKSGYAEAFVLKGGLLISSMTGVAQRTTMDMDTTVIGMDMDEHGWSDVDELVRGISKTRPLLTTCSRRLWQRQAERRGVWVRRVGRCLARKSRCEQLRTLKGSKGAQG